MNKAVILVSVLVLSVSLLVTGCGAKKESSKTKSVSVDTGAGKELQVANVQLFPSSFASAGTKSMDVVFKVTNPYKGQSNVLRTVIRL